MAAETDFQVTWDLGKTRVDVEGRAHAEDSLTELLKLYTKMGRKEPPTFDLPRTLRE